MKLLDKHENLYVDTSTYHYGPNDDKDNEILIHIPVDTLFYAMNNRQYFPLKINNKHDMVKYVVDWLLEWGRDQETGSSTFEDFLDNMFTDALESGELWLNEREEE